MRIRAEIIRVSRAMSGSGLSPGRSGNVSGRSGNGMLITPSGVAYDTLAPEDIVAVGVDGSVAPGQLKPSSEWRFHLAAYAARSDIGGIVHCHSPSATALACAKRPIPAFHYMVAAAGGNDIPVVPYATFGTEELSRHVVAGLRARNACLMANHGQIAVAGTIGAALELAHEVEVLAGMYLQVLAIGSVHVLDDAEMERVIELFKSYGQRAQSAASRQSREPSR